MARVVDAYRKVRNTFRYLLSNLYDFEYEVEYNGLLPLDKYALDRLYRVVEESLKFYDNFEFDRVFRRTYEFVVEMSYFYFEAIKDRLYTHAPDSVERRSAQTALYHILYHLSMILAPIIPHTAEEVWEHSPFRDKKESLFLEVWKEPPEEFRNDEILKDFAIIMQMRDEVFPHLEVLRRDKKVIGQNLDARVELKPSEKSQSIVDKYRKHLAEMFGVSQFVITETPTGDETFKGEFGVWAVSHAKGKKCPRCWMWFEDMGNEVCKKCESVLATL